MALTNAQRIANYRVQNGTDPLAAAKLTPRQCRRISKNARRALSPHAAVTRVSRLRKALERRERRRLRVEGAVLMQVIRDGRMSAFLSNLRKRR